MDVWIFEDIWYMNHTTHYNYQRRHQTILEETKKSASYIEDTHSKGAQETTRCSNHFKGISFNLGVQSVPVWKNSKEIKLSVEF